MHVGWKNRRYLLLLQFIRVRIKHHPDKYAKRGAKGDIAASEGFGKGVKMEGEIRVNE